jgi:uridine monophosphate synthetase
MENSTRNLVKELNRIGAIKFGSFKLKSGILSPIYIDLRVTISYPKILKQVADLMWQRVTHSQNKPSFELICGVPYTALPFAVSLSMDHDVPLLIRRKEGPKEYGTKKSVEGVFQRGQECLVVEDLVTSGGSVLEVVEALREEGLVIKDVVVFLDREQGALKEIQKHDLRFHSVFKFSEMLQILKEEQAVDDATFESILKFLEKNQMGPNTEARWQGKELSFGKRSELCTNRVASDLFKLMESKKTNLCVAVDVTTKAAKSC